MKICDKCGAQLNDNAVSCDICGAVFDPQPVLPDQPFQFTQPQQPTQPPQFDQQPQFYQTPKFDQAPQLNHPTQFSQPQQFAQPQYAQQGTAPYNVPVQKGSNKKLIIIISAAVAAIAIIIAVLFLFVFKSKKDLIIGTWHEVKENGRGSYTRFNKDGTMEYDLSSSMKATYKVDGDTLTVSIESLSENYSIDKLTDDEMVLSRRYNGKDEEIKFVKVDDKTADDSMQSKADFKTANANAKLVFTTVHNSMSDRIADGEQVNDIKTNGVVSVESLKDSNDPTLHAVYKALADNGDGMGYVFIDFTADDEVFTNRYAQWSATEDGMIIGQYPDAPKSVDEAQSMTFGKKKPKSTSMEY